ncbi:hypothetical protein [Rhodopirellula sp. MGV]|uniref:hypothetical protein n=1 Tax=Rhodopirellula sp. MGV TaxID=2023130 RepID=UPI000B97B4D4|nr:hypothetical protein [Rhodopirellula sp. MGV]OYP28858.1 hypothetical protein CGZ80_25095 [Rhodopirellula sp. MGV]
MFYRNPFAGTQNLAGTRNHVDSWIGASGCVPLSYTHGIVVAFSAVAIILVGCGMNTAPVESGDDGSVQNATLPSIEPEQYLENVIARYRSEPSYRDQGMVRMVVERDGRSSEQTAPMSVHLDGDKIRVAAYDARLWSDGERTLGWIADPNTEMHDGQVVVGGRLRGDDPSVPRPSLERMLRDPLLTEKMKAGLGGPPPQLEWLLETDPMANLFRGKQPSRIEYESMHELKGTLCVVVVAEVEGENYRFWIDRQRSIVKLVELPTSVAEMGFSVDGYQILSLELVLDGATFSPGADAFSMAPGSDFPQRPAFVRSLLPLPPSPPNSLVGTSLSPFRVRDASDQFDVSQRGVDRLLTLFVLTDPNAGDDVADDMQLISFVSLQLGNLPAEMREKVRPVAVGSPKRAGQLRQIGIDQSDWLIVSAPSVLREINSYPAVVLIDARGNCLFVAQEHMATQLTTLPSLISDTLSGVDVAKRIRQQWQADRDAYRAKLEELRVN